MTARSAKPAPKRAAPARRAQASARPLASMTGRGRGSASSDGLRVAAELTGLNRRNLDITCNLPRELAGFEPAAREIIAAAVHRGRVALTMTIEHAAAPPPSRLLDTALAKAYLEAIRGLQRELGLKDDLTVSHLLALPGVASGAAPAPDEARLFAVCEKALAAALKDFTAMRVREGAALARQLAAGIAALSGALKPILKSSTAAIAARSELIREKAARLLGQSPSPAVGGDTPILREILLIAERGDISEEIARLESHAAQFREALEAGGPVGRQLDFLAQEMGRELHTLGAKTASPEASRLVIECKIEAERLREQVQNIE